MITVLLFNNSTSQLKTIDLQGVLKCPDSHLYLINITYLPRYKSCLSKSCKMSELFDHILATKLRHPICLKEQQPILVNGNLLKSVYY